jgi:hypothetical protein
MLMRYRYLRICPDVFWKLTGLSLVEFHNLMKDVVPCYRAAEHTRRNHTGRKRAVGGGNHCVLNVTDQVLMTLIWLHRHPHQEVLGHGFGVSQPTVWRYIEKVTPLLEATIRERVTTQDPGRKQRLRLGELFEEIPELLKCIPSSDLSSDLHSSPQPSNRTG